MAFTIENVAVGYDIPIGKNDTAPQALRFSFGVDVFHNHRTPGGLLVNFAGGLGMDGESRRKEDGDQRGV